MTEEEIGRKAAQLLDRGLDDIKQNTLSRLQSIRKATLENYHVTEEVITVTHAGSAHIQGAHNARAGARKLLSALALLFAITGIIYWQTFQQSDESEDIDIMLLLDDLPVNAYLDDEFDAWLEGSGQ